MSFYIKSRVGENYFCFEYCEMDDYWYLESVDRKLEWATPFDTREDALEAIAKVGELAGYYITVEVE